MRCPSCEATISSSTRFCPRCGTLLDARHSAPAAPAAPADQAAAAGTASTQLLSVPSTGSGAQGAPGAAPPTAPIPRPGGDMAEQRVVPGTGPTAPVPVVDERPIAHRSGTGEPNALRTNLEASAERLRTAAMEVRAALVGTVILLLGFVALPYADGLGTGIGHGGRIWWRPIAAVLATVLLALALREHAGSGADDLDDPYPGAAGISRPSLGGSNGVRNHRMLVVAVVVATVGATEAGLIGLVSGGNPLLRAGYYVMLLGSVVVAAAATVAALRRAPR